MHVTELDAWMHICPLTFFLPEPIIPPRLIFHFKLTVIVKYFLAWLLSLKVHKPNWGICFPEKPTLCHLIRTPPTSRLYPSYYFPPSPIKSSLNFHISLINTCLISISALSKYQTLASESSGMLVKTQLAGPHPQSF